MPPRPVATVRSVGTTSGAKIVAAGRVNTIGLADHELSELLECLDHRESEGESAPIRRDFARWPFRHASIALRIVHPGGSEVELRLACRNISRGGASLLHNGYFHPGTACRIHLPRVGGGADEVPGVICRCSHRRGTLHELGVKFNNPVDLRRYIAPERGQEVYSLERVAPEKLKGRILLVEECHMSSRIVQHFLRETELLVTHFKTGAEALAAGGAFEVVMAGAALPDMTGQELLAKLREIGFTGAAFLMSGDPSGLAGEFGVLTKPLEHEAVMRALAERLLIAPISSAKSKAQAIGPVGAPVAPELLAEMRKTADGLRAALAAKDAVKAMPLCLILKGAAAAFNNPAFTAAANKAAAALTEPSAGADPFTLIDQLCRVCDAALKPAAG